MEITIETQYEELAQIFQAISSEREYQDQKWGGAAHDDQHSEYEWQQILYYYVREIFPSDGNIVALNKDYEGNLIKIAAVAIAALQSYSRKQNN